MSNAKIEIKEVAERIVREYQPEKIILFGSHAWGEPHEWSDIDLLVVKNSDKPKLERIRELRRLLFGSSQSLDLLVYTRRELEESINRGRNLFLEDVVRNGVVLYTQPSSEIALTHEPATLVV